MFSLFTRELDAKQFCKIILGISIVCFGLIAAVNFVVNPYAQYPTRFFRPSVQTSRDQKIELFRDVPVCPDGIILGSSRVMKLEPDYLQQKTGLRFFNAGMNYAKPEDYLAFLRFYADDTGRWPKCVILGLDIAAFSDLNLTDARLLANQELVRHITDFIPFPDRMKRWTELISWQQSTHSAKSILKQVRNQEEVPPIEEYRSDGLLVYLEREKQIAEGIYDFDSALEYNQREYVQLLRQYDAISIRRTRILAQIVKECREHDVQLHIFTTPMHPRLRSHLADKSNLEVRHQDLVSFVTRWSEKEDFTFTDLFDIQSFAGDDQKFVDGIHPLEANTRKMIDRILAPHAKANQYVVQ